MPTLERLLAGPHEVVRVISQPDRPRGRGRALQPSPVSERALAAGVPLLRPERVGDELPAGHAAPDLGVVVAFGQFLPRGVREWPSLGYCINAHASLLPRWRGAAPIARAILAGDTRTGISVMRVEREMDTGAVARVHELEIGAEEGCGELTLRLAQVAADAIAEALSEIASGRVRWREQDASRATLAPKLERGEAELDWREPARSLALRVRAFAPAPGAFTHLDGEPLRILRARAEPDPVDRAPGTARVSPDGALRVATGEGWLRPARAPARRESARRRRRPSCAAIRSPTELGSVRTPRLLWPDEIPDAMEPTRPRRGRPAPRERPGEGRAAAPTRTRVLALRVLERVQRAGAYADLLLHASLARSPLSAPDRAFATELVYGTLRWRGRLDHLLAPLPRPRARPARAAGGDGAAPRRLPDPVRGPRPGVGGGGRVGALRARARRGAVHAASSTRCCVALAREPPTHRAADARRRSRSAT